MRAEFVAEQFSGGGFGELVGEFDAARVFVWSDAMFDELLEFAGEIGSRGDTFADDDEGFGSEQFGGFAIGDDGSLQDTWVFDEDVFNFNGRNPLTGNAEHIVGAAGIPVAVVFVDPIFIASDEPGAKHALGGQLGTVPIIGRDTFSRDVEIADRAGRNFVIVGINDAEFVPGDRVAGTAGFDVAGPR